MADVLRAVLLSEENRMHTKRELATRLIDLLLHGITTTAAHSRASRPGGPAPASHHD